MWHVQSDPDIAALIFAPLAAVESQFLQEVHINEGRSLLAGCTPAVVESPGNMPGFFLRRSMRVNRASTRADEERRTIILAI